MQKSKKNVVYDTNFKIKVLNELETSTIIEVVKKHKISTTTSNGIQVVARWLSIYNAEGIAGLEIERRGRSTKSESPTKGRPPRHKNSSREEIIAENTKLRAEVDYLKKTACLSSFHKNVSHKQKALIISGLRHKYKLTTLLTIANMKRSTYYYNMSTLNPKDKYQIEKQEIVSIFTSNYNSYGYRRIRMSLRSRGYIINHKTVAKLMKTLGIKGKTRKSKYRSYKGNIGKIAPNLLNRQFTCTRPNTKWVTDVTEFAFKDSKVYLSPIMDLYNREIISYSISRIANFAQTKDMLADAIMKLAPEDKPILHSDQGWQYQMKDYQTILSSNGITQSMSRKGNCLDNCCMENFFGRLKIEMFYGRIYESSEQFIKELHKYMHYHNNQRISAKTKGMSPIDYRKHSYMIN